MRREWGSHNLCLCAECMRAGIHSRHRHDGEDNLVSEREEVWRIHGGWRMGPGSLFISGGLSEGTSQYRRSRCRSSARVLWIQNDRPASYEVRSVWTRSEEHTSELQSRSDIVC